MNRFSAAPNIALIDETELGWLELNIQRLGECVNKIHFKKGFSQFNNLVKARNNIAHSQKNVYTLEENHKSLKTIFNYFPQLQNELKENLSRAYSQNKIIRQFEKFGAKEAGNEFQRLQLVDALDDKCNPSIKEDDAVSFPENKFSKAAEKLLKPESPAQKDSLAYARGHNGLRTSILTDIVEWITKTNNRLTSENPFIHEEGFIKNIQPLTAEAFTAGKIDELRSEYTQLPSVNEKTRGAIGQSSVDFQFYKNKIEQPDKLQKAITEKENTLTAIKEQLDSIEQANAEKDNLLQQVQHIEATLQPLKLQIKNGKTEDSISNVPADSQFYKNEQEQAEQLQEAITEKENALTAIKGQLESIERANAEKDNLIQQVQHIEAALQSLKLQIKNEQDIITEKNILLRNFKNDIETAYTERKNNWELEQIEKSRKSFMQELYDKIARFRKLENLVSPFIEDLGYLWDLSNTPFQDNGFEILQQYASLLENDEFLTELAKLLGRQGREQSRYEKELRDKIEIITEYEPKPAYRGEISGLRLSNEISAALPSELALYKNSRTKKYFMLKFAQKQLLSYAYERDNPILREQITQEKILVEKSDNEPKGPIIICVDTSGSMHGAPEQIAKTVTFALAKIAMNEKRSCYLISFSTGIETLDLSSFKGADALSKLVQFLRMSFNGGTDAAPALTHAVKQLQTNEWKNADVLMVSDFVMGELPAGLEEKIKAEQEKETGFYSLVIGSDGNKQTLKAFNENWNYNPGNTDAQKELVRQLDSLRRRKTKN
ncbi:VWA domain-containing protein [Treponema sp. OMZ 788]|nr:VWA domain-containing protein [Treponema sp. OMZ 788]